MNQVRLVFLGTSAGTPSPERNLPAVALVMDGRALLFDCGEGTQQQILRSSVRPGAIEAIFISHIQGDHLYGLPGLLSTMSLHGRSEPLSVFGPERVAQYLRGVYEASYAHTSFDLKILAVSDGATVAGDGYDVHARLLDHTAPCLGYCVAEHDRAGTFDVERAHALGVPAGPLYRALRMGNDGTLAAGRRPRRAQRQSRRPAPPRTPHRVLHGYASLPRDDRARARCGHPHPRVDVWRRHAGRGGGAGTLDGSGCGADRPGGGRAAADPHAHQPTLHRRGAAARRGAGGLCGGGG